jgi:hypothetical protein
MARHKLLFIYSSHKNHFSVLAIENILSTCLKSCELLLENITTGCKLPNNLTDYQVDQLEKLSRSIGQIVAQ